MGAGDRDVRMKIVLDMRRPLRRGIFIKFAEEEKVWISFQYEQLPNFCFIFGRMGHALRECQIAKESGEERKGKELPYKSFLKAGNKLQKVRSEGGKGQRAGPRKYIKGEEGQGKQGEWDGERLLGGAISSREPFKQCATPLV